jgi:heat shock protein HslJ
MKRAIYYVLIFGVVALLGFLGWRIIGNNDQPVSTGEAPAADPIQNTTWQWVSVTDQSTGAVTDVPIPNKYTITFNSDGTVDGKADCNSFSGTYSMTNGVIITIGTSTKVLCGENSMDQQFLQLLSSVVAGGPDGSGGLALESAGGAQRMLFK